MAGGGIGEAALIGAAVGGGSALITGKDPLQAALLGAAMGGVGGAFGGAAGAGGGAGAGTGAGAGAGAAGAGAGSGALAGGAGGASGTLTSAVPMNVAGSGAINTIPRLSQIPVGGATGAATTGAATAAGQQVAQQTAQPGFFQNLLNKYSGLSTPEKIGVGIAGSTLLSKAMEPNYLDMDQFTDPEMRRAMKSLAYYKFDPKKYQAAYANGGGITDLDVGNTSRMPSNPVIMMRSGGISDLGSYSDGGRLLKGPGDGVSDGIPAIIGRKQPARLADGEFVVPARIVSELGNGSTDAGARQLYAMMNRIQSRRGKTTGKGKVAVDSKARKLLPA